MVRLWLIILLVLSIAGKLHGQRFRTRINSLYSLDYVAHSFRLPVGRFSFKIKVMETLVIFSNVQSSYSVPLIFCFRTL